MSIFIDVVDIVDIYRKIRVFSRRYVYCEEACLGIWLVIMKRLFDFGHKWPYGVQVTSLVEDAVGYITEYANGG